MCLYASVYEHINISVCMHVNLNILCKRRVHIHLCAHVGMPVCVHNCILNIMFNVHIKCKHGGKEGLKWEMKGGVGGGNGWWEKRRRVTHTAVHRL